MAHRDLYSFLSRLPTTATDKHREIVVDSLNIASAFRDKASAIRADRRYTDDGKRDAVRTELNKGTREHFNNVRAQIIGELAEVSKLRKELMPKSPDRNDLVGELQRQEVRTWLRGMTDIERMRVALETKDEQIISAIINAPAVLSGIADDLRQSLIESLMEKQHGEKLAGLKIREDTLAIVKSAVDTAAAELEREADMRQGEL